MISPQEQWRAFKREVLDHTNITAEMEHSFHMVFFAGMASLTSHGSRIPDHLRDEEMDEFTKQLFEGLEEIGPLP
jgi:hypothetical protein